MLKLSRKQELALIDLGLNALIDKLSASPKPKSVKVTTPKSTNKKRWTKERRARFAETMARKFANKHK